MVVGVDQVEAGGPDHVGQRPPERLLRRRVAPDDVPLESTRTTGSGRCRNASTMDASCRTRMSARCSDPGSDPGSAVSDRGVGPRLGRRDRTQARTRDRTPARTFRRRARWGIRRPSGRLTSSSTIHGDIWHHQPSPHANDLAPCAPPTSLLTYLRCTADYRPCVGCHPVACPWTLNRSPRGLVRAPRAGCGVVGLGGVRASYAPPWSPSSSTRRPGRRCRLRLHRHHLPPGGRPGHGPHRLQPPRGAQRLPAPHRRRAVPALDHARQTRRGLRAAHRQRAVAARRWLGVLLRRRPAHPGSRRLPVRAATAAETSIRPAPGGSTSSRCSASSASCPRS